MLSMPNVITYCLFIVVVFLLYCKSWFFLCHPWWCFNCAVHFGCNHVFGHLKAKRQRCQTSWIQPYWEVPEGGISLSSPPPWGRQVAGSVQWTGGGDASELISDQPVPALCGRHDLTRGSRGLMPNGHRKPLTWHYAADARQEIAFCRPPRILCHSPPPPPPSPSGNWLLLAINYGAEHIFQRRRTPVSSQQLAPRQHIEPYIWLGLEFFLGVLWNSVACPRSMLQRWGCRLRRNTSTRARVRE